MKPIKEVEQPEKKMWSRGPQRNGDYYVAGFYWRRQISTHATAMIEINQYGHIWRSEDRCVADLLSRGDYEFIGPINLSDTEELLALREEAAELRRCNATQADSILEFQQEQKALMDALRSVPLLVVAAKGILNVVTRRGRKGYHAALAEGVAELKAAVDQVPDVTDKLLALGKE